MTWFVIELEIFLYGKDTEYVKSDVKDSAIYIAINNVKKKYSCPENHIEVISCYEKT